MQIACPSCRKQLKVPETAAGKRVKCPACGEIFPAVEEAEEIIEAPAKRPRRASPPVEEEEESRPRRPRDEYAEGETDTADPAPPRWR